MDLKHLYTERRMAPLNLYLREVDGPAARDAVIDYGQAVKDLAATNIFPGDMLLKNFGVTRQGRVVFYDYDELCPLTDCQFRELPPARDFDEEFGSEPWFYVGPNDVFPEEFIYFLGLAGDQREAFLEAHADLLTARAWREIQARHVAGELIDIVPYRPGRRSTPSDPPASPGPDSVFGSRPPHPGPGNVGPVGSPKSLPPAVRTIDTCRSRRSPMLSH